MKTLSYFIEASAEFVRIFDEIVVRIPCFADWYLIEDTPYLVTTITCREPDAAFVEAMLAPLV